MWKTILALSLIIIGLVTVVFVLKLFMWIIIPAYIAGIISALWLQRIFNKKKTPKKEK